MAQTQESNAKRSDLTRTALLALVGRRGPLSRAAIARELDLTPAAVGLVAQRLKEQGLLEELDLGESTGGRPGRRLGLVGTAGRAVGAKVGLDHLTMVDMQLDGRVVFSRVDPFDATASDAVTRLGAQMQSFIEEAEVHAIGVGIGVPGVVPEVDVGNVHAPALGWSDVPLGRHLRGVLGVPVLVENGVKALAFAERLYGLGRTHQTFAVLTIGRGVGFAAVADGVVHRGTGGRAGEIGHVVVDEDGPLCDCGNRGCLEAIAGEQGLQRAAGQAQLPCTAEGTAWLGKLADSGDHDALAIYAHAATQLGRVVAGPVATLDPEVLLVAGEGSVDWRHWERPFLLALGQHLPPWWSPLPVTVDSWDNTGWAQGAAAMVLATPLDQNPATRSQRPELLERLYNNQARTTGPTR